MKKKAKSNALVRIHIHIKQSRESFEELTFVLQKLIKPPNRWLIEE
jgi:hypothetical protein